MAADQDDGAWFLPKRYGYGAGLPIAWQGWALLGVYIVGAAVAGYAAPPSLAGPSIIVSTAILILVAALKTRGTWRWRWGERD